MSLLCILNQVLWLNRFIQINRKPVLYKKFFSNNVNFLMQLVVHLKELRNRILHTILVWSLFSLMWLYVGLHFLEFLFQTWFFVFLCFLWIKTLKYVSSCYVILICNFVLTLYKNSRFINNKLFIKILQYYVKTCFQRCFDFFKKKSFIKKSVEQSKNKECKKGYHKKKSATKVFQVCIGISKVYDSFITALLLWRYTDI